MMVIEGVTELQQLFSARESRPTSFMKVPLIQYAGTVTALLITPISDKPIDIELMIAVFNAYG